MKSGAQKRKENAQQQLLL